MKASHVPVEAPKMENPRPVCAGGGLKIGGWFGFSYFFLTLGGAHGTTRTTTGTARRETASAKEAIPMARKHGRRIVTMAEKSGADMENWGIAIRKTGIRGL